jgi:hypothetical protein
VKHVRQGHPIPVAGNPAEPGLKQDRLVPSPFGIARRRQLPEEVAKEAFVAFPADALALGFHPKPFVLLVAGEPMQGGLPKGSIDRLAAGPVWSALRLDRVVRGSPPLPGSGAWPEPAPQASRPQDSPLAVQQHRFGLRREELHHQGRPCVPPATGEVEPDDPVARVKGDTFDAPAEITTQQSLKAMRLAGVRGWAFHRVQGAKLAAELERQVPGPSGGAEAQDELLALRLPCVLDQRAL